MLLPVVTLPVPRVPVEAVASDPATPDFAAEETHVVSGGNTGVIWWVILSRTGLQHVRLTYMFRFLDFPM